MPRVSSMLLAVGALLAVGSSGCTQVVAVSEYTFDRNPCGPRPPSCTGGASRTYLVVAADVPRLDAEGHREGFDFDGTDERVCRQPDFTSADGVTGIDNQLAPAFESLEALTGMALGQQNRDAYLAGRDLSMVFIENLDDPMNDDCVSLGYHGARVPRDAPMPLDLDLDDDGEVDPNQAFDYLPGLLTDPTACVIDGVLYARFPSGRFHLGGIDGELLVDQARLTMPLDETRVEGLLLGGAVQLGSLPEGLPVEVGEFLMGRADLSPSSRSANDCSSISFAAIMEAVPAARGEQL